MTNVPTPKGLDEINQDFETRAAQQKAQDFGMQFVDLLHYPINPDVLVLVPLAQVQAAKAVPFYKNGRLIRVAVTQEKNEELPVLIHTLETLGYHTELWFCSVTGYQKTVELYESDLVQRKQVEIIHDFQEGQAVNITAQFEGFAKLISNLELKPVTQALNEIEIAAIQARASDIHLQPYAKKGELRFRIDGVLHTVGEISAAKTLKIVGQVKYEGGMKANITDVPQDGHITFRANDRKIDLRVSSLPTEYGESIVMRVLDSERGIKTFTELGFDKDKEQEIVKVLKKKNGLVLVTGPTGSGKTTTLYAMLKELNTPEKKLVTLEDPIEYHLDNVTQSQVSSNGEYDFGNGLRALLRHDPDVILIGEIRDLDTAKLAAEAAMTGHTVLSSLHTNSAIGAVARLRNLGLESFNIGSSINAIFAQRLVRKACPHCSTLETFDLNTDERIKLAIDNVLKAYPHLKEKIEYHSADIIKVRKAQKLGCEKCAKSGYDGQTVLAEVVFLTDGLRAEISEDASELQLEKFVRTENPKFLNLFEDGVRKAILGETTIDEVYRVAG